MKEIRFIKLDNGGALQILVWKAERDAGIDTISMQSNACPSTLRRLFFSVSYSVMLTAKL